MRSIRSILQFIWARPARVGLAILVIGVLLSIRPISAQKTPPPSGVTPVSMIVTVEARHGQQVPPLVREDVVVQEGSSRDPVTGWVPLTGDHASLDLFVMLDDASDTYVTLQYSDIRTFINEQPATTRVAVGYMRNNTFQMEQDFTADHAAAAKSIRIPMGVNGNNPYFSLLDLMKRWPAGAERREILLISDGIDPGQGIADPWVDSVIEQAEKNRILIYSIYATGVSRFGHDFRRINLGENNLSKVAGETGAEAWFQGFHTPISFAPFLEVLSAQLNHQYLLTFNVKPQAKDSYRHVKLETEVSNAELITADRVYVPAAR